MYESDISLSVILFQNFTQHLIFLCMSNMYFFSSFIEIWVRYFNLLNTQYYSCIFSKLISCQGSPSSLSNTYDIFNSFVLIVILNSIKLYHLMMCVIYWEFCLQKYEMPWSTLNWCFLDYLWWMGVLKNLICIWYFCKIWSYAVRLHDNVILL